MRFERDIVCCDPTIFASTRHAQSFWRGFETDPGGVTNPLVPVGSQGVPQDPKIADFKSLLARVCAILVRSPRMRCHTKRLGRALRTRQLLLRSDQNYEHPACEHFFWAGIDRSWRCHEPTGAHGVHRIRKSRIFEVFWLAFAQFLSDRQVFGVIQSVSVVRFERDIICCDPTRTASTRRIKPPGFGGLTTIPQVQWGQCHVGTPGRVGGRSWGGLGRGGW